MADRTSIEWTDATVNPIRARLVGSDGTARMGWHCEHVSEGCRHWYAEAMNRDRFGTGLDYKPGHLATHGGEVEIVFADKAIREVLRWRRPRRIFVCSMTDLFADFVPDWMIDRVFAAMALCPQHTFQVLTKRPKRMQAYIDSRTTGWQGILANAFEPGTLQITKNDIERAFGLAQKFSYDPPTPTWPLPNVWLGVTAERQQEADERIPILLDTPAAKRFASVEPMLGAMDLTEVAISRPDLRASVIVDALRGTGGYGPRIERLDWVICGGESGPGARPMHPDWVRSLRDQCAAAGTPFLFKQWGEWGPADDYPSETQEDYDVRGLTEGASIRVGKRAAGRLLDGVVHDAFPEG